MKRIFAPFAYGNEPRRGCWWDETAATPDWPVLRESIRADVAIVGAGFTGISAALHLAEAGVRAVVLEAESPGWGASGRNGGFCCLGGGKISDTALNRKFGAGSAAAFRKMEQQSVTLVADLISRHGIDADTHSNGETQLAHRPRDMERFRKRLELARTETGPAPMLIEAGDLEAHGMRGPFHGALTDPVGFGLNPRKYLFGLARAAQMAGAGLFQNSPVNKIARRAAHYLVSTPEGDIRCDQVIIATNGYSSEDMPDWMAARYLPTQSTVLVTRPLRNEELQAQGWTSDQMAYDTRHLLHYFRLMPDRRFLFGMRGGLTSSPAAELRARQRTRRDFERMFPAWKNVPSPNSWSGMVCLTHRRFPFVGPVPGQPGMFAGFGYHGNGVAMGTCAGKILASFVRQKEPGETCPEYVKSAPKRFPLGRARRLLMAPAYAGFALCDL